MKQGKGFGMLVLQLLPLHEWLASQSVARARREFGASQQSSDWGRQFCKQLLFPQGTVRVLKMIAISRRHGKQAQVLKILVGRDGGRGGGGWL